MALLRGHLPINRRVILLITCALFLVLYAFFWRGAPQSLERSLSKQKNATLLDDKDRRALEILDRKLEQERAIMENEVVLGSVPFTWNTENPLRIVLLSSWRSGSTILGRILSNHSATFNWYEPLMPFVHQVTEGPTAEEAVSHLQSLFHCRCPDRYLDYVWNNTMQMTAHNPGISDVCPVDPSLAPCRSKTFLEISCSRFPIQVMKLVRFRVSLMERFLSDPLFLRMKIIYLVRDPRAVMSSRWKLGWCNELPDCKHPGILCDLLSKDLQAFERLSNKFQGRMLLVKYEDMALDPVKVIKDVFHFAGLQFTSRIENAVKERTSQNGRKIPWDTQRKSQQRIDSWKKELSPQRIAYVEQFCFGYLNKMGYPLHEQH